MMTTSNHTLKNYNFLDCIVIGLRNSYFSLELDATYRGMFAMYHSKTPEDIQKEVLESLIDPSGMVRVVFATSALGMGVNLPNVRRIIHFGIPRDMEEYVQEVGRGGRDGEKFEALMMYKSYHLAVCEADMKAYVKNPNSECRRKLIMQSFKEKMSSQGNNPECCDVCASKEESGATLPDISASFGSPNIATQPMFSRSVDEEDKTLLQEVLLEHVCSNVTTSVFGIGNLVNAIERKLWNK